MCNQESRLLLHSTAVLPLFDSSGITLVWLSCKSVDFDWIEIYIISSWEFWRLITHYTESVISLFYFHSRINPDMLLHIAAPYVFFYSLLIQEKNHVIKDVPTIVTWLWLKKKAHPDPHLLFLSLSKMKEILIKLFDKNFPFCTVPGKGNCVCGRRQWHSYDRLQSQYRTQNINTPLCSWLTLYSALYMVLIITQVNDRRWSQHTHEMTKMQADKMISCLVKPDNGVAMDPMNLVNDVQSCSMWP